jgi:hypothetical protein
MVSDTNSMLCVVIVVPNVIVTYVYHAEAKTILEMLPAI